MPAAKTTLWRSKKEPDGKVPLYLTLRHGGKRATMALAVRVAPSLWNARAGEVRKNQRDAGEMNKYLSRIKDDAESALGRAVMRADSNPCQSAKAELEVK